MKTIFFLPCKDAPKDNKSIYKNQTWNIPANCVSSHLLLGCDQSFMSTSAPSSKDGSFRAPIFLNPDEHVLQCTYSFVALEGERVQLEFDEFDLQGTPPE